MNDLDDLDPAAVQRPSGSIFYDRPNHLHLYARKLHLLDPLYYFHPSGEYNPIHRSAIPVIHYIPLHSGKHHRHL